MTKNVILRRDKDDIVCNYEERIEISRRMKTVVDGNGAERIAKDVMRV